MQEFILVEAWKAGESMPGCPFHYAVTFHQWRLWHHHSCGCACNEGIPCFLRNENTNIPNILLCLASWRWWWRKNNGIPLMETEGQDLHGIPGQPKLIGLDPFLHIPYRSLPISGVVVYPTLTVWFKPTPSSKEIGTERREEGWWESLLVVTNS